MESFRTLYEELQVHENASPEVIHAAWVSLRRKWEPSQHPGRRDEAEEVLRTIEEAYRVLSDPVLRHAHDVWISARRNSIDRAGSAPSGTARASWDAPPGPGRAVRRGFLAMTLIAAGWVALFAALWWSFDQYLEHREYPNRNLLVAEGHASELVLRRNHAGHYLAPGTINGEPVVFLLDTGATQVSVPSHLRDRLGLQAGSRGRALTANGTVDVWQTRIPELGLGPFVFRDVRGHLNPGAGSDQVLLGMSVLKHLDFAQRGEHLVLRLP